MSAVVGDDHLRADLDRRRQHVAVVAIRQMQPCDLSAASDRLPVRNRAAHERHHAPGLDGLLGRHSTARPNEFGFYLDAPVNWESPRCKRDEYVTHRIGINDRRIDQIPKRH